MRRVLDLNFGWAYSETFAPEMTKPDYDDKAFAVLLNKTFVVATCGNGISANERDHGAYLRL